MEYKRVTLFAGHYGSGKTTAAVSYALALRQVCPAVTVADLDIVNPYFRTKDSADVLSARDIQLISSPYANSNVDLPALPSQMYAIVEDTRRHFVVDVGGDDRGALALGRLTEGLLAENNYEMLFVINRYRPLTASASAAAEVLKEIEAACRLPFTHIANCSNIGAATTKEDILASLDYAKEVSSLCGLPIKLTALRQELFDSVKNDVPGAFAVNCDQYRIAPLLK